MLWATKKEWETRVTDPARHEGNREHREPALTQVRLYSVRTEWEDLGQSGRVSSLTSGAE